MRPEIVRHARRRERKTLAEQRSSSSGLRCNRSANASPAQNILCPLSLPSSLTWDRGLDGELRTDGPGEFRRATLRGKHTGQKKQIARLQCFGIRAEWLRRRGKLDAKFF